MLFPPPFLLSRVKVAVFENWLLLLSPGVRALAGALEDKAGLSELILYNNSIGVEGRSGEKVVGRNGGW
jgi:hypothetical protein